MKMSINKLANCLTWETVAQSVGTCDKPKGEERGHGKSMLGSSVLSFCSPLIAGEISSVLLGAATAPFIKAVNP